MRIAALVYGYPAGRLLRHGAFLLFLAAGTAVTGEAVVRGRLDGSHLDAPTRVYARPIVLAAGETLSRDRVERHLRRLGYVRTRRSRVQIGEYRLGSRTWVIGRRAFRLNDRIDSGGVTIVELGSRGHVWSVRDARGVWRDAVALEPEMIGTVRGSGPDRVPVRLSEVPQHLVDALLTIEDQRFYDHHGLDVRRIGGALLANVRAGRVVQGASTLSQQLAKNLFLSARRSPVRKVREMALALALEIRYDKDELLEAYLNEVYLGQDAGLPIHGVGRAAQYYFGKDVTQLGLAESALLAGIIRGPNLYAPFRRPEVASARRNLVLDLMHERGLVDAGAHTAARGAPLALRGASPSPGRHGRYFMDHVTQGIVQRHGPAAPAGGLAVFTTLDMHLQRVAERVVTEELLRLERAHPYLAEGDGSLQAALVALDPRSGEILAMVGGRDYGQSQFNRVLFGRRQPGSAFKPIVALAALSYEDDAGRWDAPAFTLASVLEDEPLSVETPAGVWEPENYDRSYRGNVTLRDALERSLNVPFARLGLAVGPERIVETARRLGIGGSLQAVPSIALGSNEVSPLELTRAYGVLGASGYRADPVSTIAVFDRAGQMLERIRPSGERVYDPAETYLVTSALRGAVERGTGRALRRLGYDGAVAAKSGTTNDFRDAWFIGYTPTLAVGVWVGFDEGRVVGLPGSRAALPIFAAFLRGAFGASGDDGRFRMPLGVEVADVDLSAAGSTGGTCVEVREVFLSGTAPRSRCAPWRSTWRRYRDSARRWYRDDLVPLIENLRRRGRSRRSND